MTSAPGSPGRLLSVKCGLIVARWLAWTGTPAAQTVPLKQLTIGQLMDIDVTTAKRREEPIRVTPAAISVISATGQDLLHDQHPERPLAPGRTEFERAVRVGVALRY